MNIYKAKTVDIQSEDENYLSSVYFYFNDDQYFSICRNIVENEQQIYVELNDQAYSTYTNKLNYEIDGDKIVFLFNENVSKALHLSNSRIEIFYSLNKGEKEHLENVVNRIKTI